MAPHTYFAYGSNMLSKRLKKRCPGATLITTAYVKGYILAFTKPGRVDSSGKATLIKTQSESNLVFGVLYEIQTRDLKALDEIEGNGMGYDRIEGLPATPFPKRCPIRATTYIAPETDNALKPYDWYKALVLAGAKEHALPGHWINTLEKPASMPDPKPDRPARLEALEILNASQIQPTRCYRSD